MPRYDFFCPMCEENFEEWSFQNAEIGRVQPVEHWCGTLCEMRWLKAPGVVSTERLDPALKRSLAFQYGIHVDRRDEYDAACQRLGVVPEIENDFDKIMKAGAATPENWANEELTKEQEREIEETCQEMIERAEAGTLPPVNENAEGVDLDDLRDLVESSMPDQDVIEAQAATIEADTPNFIPGKSRGDFTLDQAPELREMVDQRSEKKRASAEAAG